MRAVVVVSTAPSAVAARRIARVLVGSRAAACVTVVPKAASVYRWKGKIKNADEALLLIKTTAKNFVKVEKAIRLNHPYSVPEIIGLPIVRGSKEHLSWLDTCVR